MQWNDPINLNKEKKNIKNNQKVPIFNKKKERNWLSDKWKKKKDENT